MSLIEEFDFSVLAERSILVLSDAYPPYAAGGAELSLRASIEFLPKNIRDKIVVISFTGAVDEISLTQDNACIVIHAPKAMGWPYQELFSKDFDRIKSFAGLGERNYARFVRIKKSYGPESSAAARRAYAEARISPAGGILTDHFIDASDVRVRFVTEAAAAMRSVDCLVCDNTRSVLIGSALLESQIKVDRSVAVVRDNRFHCARPSQSRIVERKPCSVCDFSCANVDVDGGANDVALRKETLATTEDFRQAALRKYDSVIVTSHELKRHIANVVSDQQDLVRIPNPIGDISKISQYVEGVAQAPQPTLLIIGMLNENKGQLEFLKAVTRWLQSNPEVRILFAGRGKRIAGRMKSLIQEHGWGKRVRLLGYRPRQSLFEEIAKSTLVVAPTVWNEPFGRVPLEAAACRKAIVAFGVGGLNESIVHGKTGMIVKPGDYQGLFAAIEELIDDGKRRSEMEENAYAWVQSAYSEKNTTQVFAQTAFALS
jgi:glycosyltransferase involved in cell wall biosynthesis